MSVALEIADEHASKETFDAVFAYLTSVDEQFSPFKETSEVSRINRGEIPDTELSAEMREVLEYARRTKEETSGYFNITKPDGRIDPSGIVKGWAILNAAKKLHALGYDNFCLDVGGDIQSSGVNESGESWSVGIRNPFNREEIVKVIYPYGKGVATSGSYIRGAHIYNPHVPDKTPEELVSLTLVGPDVCEADRYATAAFAMGKDGLLFVEHLPGFEAYGIDPKGIATMTSGFAALTTL